MKLVYLLLSPTFGMHQYTSGLANRLTDMHDVSLVTTAIYPEDRYSPDVSLHTPVVTSNTGLSIESLRYWQISKVKRAILDLEPDVVHITGPHLWNVVIVKWLRRHGIPVVHTIHDLDPHVGAGYGRLLHIWNDMISQVANKLLVHGRVYRERLIESGLPDENVVCIPLLHLFVGYGNMSPAADAADEPLYEKCILFFGRLEEYKGVEVLLEAYRQVCKSIRSVNAAPTLVLAGKGDLDKKWSDLLPEGVELRNRLIDDDEAINLFRSCSVVVLPYLDGTQSAVIPSAYYFQKPVIATKVGALPEYIEEGKTGLLVAPGDPQALAQAILSVIDDEPAIRRMGTAGRKWYDQQREQELSSLIGLYEKVRAN